jgi:tryptophanyl-tRNA synthetase
MSKSLGNVILISDPPEVISKKIMTAITDPEKIRMGDPGHPEICNVFAYHQRFNAEAAEGIAEKCRSGELGCVECKKMCGNVVSDYLAPIRDRRAGYEANPGAIRDLLRKGAERARERARSTMQDVRRAMHLAE